MLSPDPEARRRKALRRVEEEEKQVLDQYSQQMDSIRSQNQSQWEIGRQIRQCDEQFAPRFEEFRERRREAQGKQRNVRKVKLCFSNCMEMG